MLRSSTFRRWGLALLACALTITHTASPAAHAASQLDLVHDFSDTALATSSYPTSFTTLGSTVYFFAAGDLWKTNGVSSGTTLVKHFPLGEYGLLAAYDADYPMVTNGATLFFTANDGVHGEELWRSDGTPDGTSMVADIFTGPAGSNPDKLTVVNNQLVFSANDGVHDSQIWKTDGTAAGTQAVTTPDQQLQYVSEIAPTTGNCFVFSATTSAAGSELWKSCGDSASTSMVKDIYAGTDGSYPSSMLFFNGVVYFSARDVTFNYQLWKSDLTDAGTVLLTTADGSYGADPRDIITNGARVFFSATTNARGRELWTSDGTLAGTKMVGDINPGADGSEPRDLKAFGTSIVFGADDGTHGQELWVSNIPGATYMVADINPDSGDSEPNGFVLSPDNSRVFFAANDGTHGQELWETTLAINSTVMVADTAPGSASGLGTGFYSSLSNNGAAGPASSQEVYFMASNGTNGYELFLGRHGGAAMLKDIVPGHAGLAYYPIGTIGSQAFVSAAPSDPADPTPDAQHYELWRTAGDAASTASLHQYPVSDYIYTLNSGPSLTIGNKMYFVASTAEAGQELWVTDGSVDGTKMVQDLEPGTNSSSPGNLTNVNGTLYFTAITTTNNYKLWHLDANGIPQLVSGYGEPSEYNYVETTAVAQGVLYFFGTTVATGKELWKIKSDGTAAMVKDFCPGSCDGLFWEKQLLVAGGKVFVNSYDGSDLKLFQVLPTDETVQLDNTPINASIDEYTMFDWNGALGFWRNEQELWKSDGTAAGTAKVASVAFAPKETVVSGNKAYYSTGLQLGVSDGTAAGTTTLLDKPFPGTYTSGDISHLTIVGKHVLFTASTPTQGNELWASDGTVAGTQIIDLVAGEGSSWPLNLMAPNGGNAVFTAETPDAGRELWATDGTAAGTHRLIDIAAGAVSSDPDQLVLAGNKLIFVAHTAEGNAGMYSLDRGVITPYTLALPLVQR